MRLGDGAAAGSDGTFLEQAKLKAREAWKCTSSYGEAVHFDSAPLEQAKLKLGKLCTMI